MTSKLVVNTIEADTGISSVSFASSISMNSTAKFHFSAAGIDIGADTNINRPSAGVLGFNINGSQKVVITSNGRLGIGTNNPTQLIEVQDRSTGTLCGLNVGTQYGNAHFGGYNNYPAIMNSGNQPLIYCDTNNDRTIFFGDTVGFGTTCAFRVNNAEKVRITSAGRMGINETSPDNLLHLSTNDSSAYSTSTTNTVNATNALLILENKNGSDGSGVNNYVGMRFIVANGANSDAQFQYVREGDNKGAFHFKARNAGSTYPNLMKISSAGYVTKPMHPAFHASRRGGNVSSNNYVVFDQVDNNNGSHYNNSDGKFTAPVAGIYFFAAWHYTGGTSAFSLRINGQQYGEYAWSDDGGHASWVASMTAGQYAQIYTQGYTWRGTAGYHNGFCGYLIG